MPNITSVETPVIAKRSHAPTSTATGTQPRLITIAPKMPGEQFIGTPVPGVSIPNLEIPGHPVLSAQMPEGVSLISLKAPVTTSSSGVYAGELPFVTDGDAGGTFGNILELDGGKQWVQLDLGATKEVWGLWVWHSHKEANVYKGVVIQVSDDAAFKQATTVFNNDFDNSVGLGVGKDNSYVETNNGHHVDAKGTKGRYVRLWTNGRYVDEINHYCEVSVYGK
jgi:hypothetical protein